MSYAVNSRYGLLETLDPERDLISRHLAHYGEWAHLEARFVSDALGRDKRVADIGGFLGTFSLGLAELCAPSSIVIVEANSEVLPMLKSNVTRNCNVEAEIVEAAILPRGLNARARVDPGNAGSLSFDPDAEGERIDADEVEQRLTIREFAERHGPFDLIKIDAEGIELALLKDDLAFFAAGAPNYWIEANESPASIELVELFLSLGFRVSLMSFPAFSVDNFSGREENDFPFAHEAGVWVTRNAVPELSQSLSSLGCRLVHIADAEGMREALWRTPRWGARDWLGAVGDELAAVATRTMSGQSFSSFLKLDDDMAGRNSGAVANAELEAELARVREEASAEAGRHKAEAEALKAETEALKAEAEAQKAEAEALKAEAEVLKAEVETWKAQAEALDTQLQEVRSEFASKRELWENERQDLKDEIARQSNLARSLEVLRSEDRSRMVQAAQVAAADYGALNRQKDEVQNELNRVVGEYYELSDRLGELGEECARLRQAETELGAMQATLSWRLTRPLRAVRRRF